MSPKTAKTSKPAAKKEIKATAPAKKAGKASKAAIEDEAPVQMASADDQEELEEQAEEAASSSAGGGGNDAALAAVAGGTEMSASLKNFRHHPDMENFYTFIFENDLRHEALAIIDTMQAQKQTRKLVKGAKAQAH